MERPFDHLPENVVVEILSWLPPESLLLVKFVGKSWYILINTLVEDPKFVTKHLHNSSTKTPSLVFKCLKDDNKRLVQGSLSIRKDEDNNERLSYVMEDFKPLRHIQLSTKIHGKDFLAVCHCNGIICHFDYCGKAILCNPATMEYTVLPDPWFSEEKISLRIGFGYDPVDQVYKVIRVFGWFLDLKAKVFTLGVDDSWREIKLQTEEKEYHFGTSKELYCKGFYYWLLKSHFSREETIHSFDMHSEEFHNIPLPYSYQSMEPFSVSNTTITLWNESVALFYYPSTEWVTTKPIEMWAMQEPSEGGQISYWTKLLSIGPLGEIFKIPITFWAKDELLMREGDKGLISYNLLSKKVVRLHIGEMTWFHAFGYVKSLVSIIGSRKFLQKDLKLNKSGDRLSTIEKDSSATWENSMISKDVDFAAHNLVKCWYSSSN